MLSRLLLFVTVLCSILFAQEELKYTDISPDGKSVVSRVNGEFKPFVITTTTAPFGTTPFWTAGLERQIGGLAFGDYDMDGDLDLAAGCYFSQSFPPISEYNNIIFRNDNGVLTVNPVWFSDDSRSTTDIKWADINNDGKPDLFSGNGDGGYAPSTIYLNTGTGVPTTPSFTFTGQAWTVGTAFNDINGDGLLDLAVGNQGNTSDPYKPIFYYINQGTGFTSTPTYTSSDMMITNSVAFTDLNNSDLTRVQETFTIPETGKGAVHLSKTPIYKIHSVTVSGVPVQNYCSDPVGAFVSIGGCFHRGHL
ncbi:MAG: VCBS repeat-containing protein [Ignavibacteriales bacterium]|nr:VCBS repeat-containing protein [Ignavibacteriales bacterium]